MLNTYRVLATRGTRGTRLYSTDQGTLAYLHQLVHPDGHEPGTVVENRR